MFGVGFVPRVFSHFVIGVVLVVVVGGGHGRDDDDGQQDCEALHPRRVRVVGDGGDGAQDDGHDGGDHQNDQHGVLEALEEEGQPA